jgi:cell division protein FtsQ
VVRLAGIGNRTNLLTLPAERVERALGENPWIRSVQAHRSLPSTLVLTIDERVPVAWAQAPKGVAVVAADGTVLVHRKHPPKGLVAIGSSARPLAPGDTLEGLDEPLAAAASLAPPVRRVVRSAQLQRGELVLRLVGGTRVRYGEPRAVAEKSAALAKVLRWSAEQAIDLAYVDLSVAGNPAVRARGSGAPS